MPGDSSTNRLLVADVDDIDPEGPGPTKILYKMVGAHKPQYWKIIRLVAKYKYRDIPIKELRTKHCAFAWCPRCDEEIECKVGNSNARQHMETCHPQVLRDYEAEQVVQVVSQRGTIRALVSDFDGAEGQQQPKKLKAISELQQRQLNNLLARWIAISLRPLALIEDVGFREVIKFIADLAAVELHLPGRTQVRDDIMRIAAELRLKLQEVLAKECLYFSLTTDTWTDRGQRSFMALTLHYLTESFDVRSWTLEVKHFPGKHTGDAIARAITEAMERWNLDRHRCTILLRDGAANVASAGEILDMKHMSCLAHTLHLVVAGAMQTKKQRKKKKNREESNTTEYQSLIDDEDSNGSDHEDEDNEVGFNAAPLEDNPDLETEAERAVVAFLRDVSLDEVMNFVNDSAGVFERDALERMRGIVQEFRRLASYFRRSSKGSDLLLKLQREYSRSETDRELRILLDCPTRWNTCWDMIQRFIKLHTALDHFFAYLDSSRGRNDFSDASPPRPNASKWFAIKCLRTLLAPFAAATDRLEGQDYPTFSLALPCLRHIRGVLQNPDVFRHEEVMAGDEPYVVDILLLMRQVQKTMLKLFDNRFSKVCDELHWVSLLDPRLVKAPHLTSEERSKAIEALVGEATQISMGDEFPLPDPEPATEDNSQLATPNKATAALDDSLFGAVEPEIDTRNTSTTTSANASSCLDEFNDYRAIASKAKRDDDPLKWWCENRDKFPTLAKLARKWLGCVATSAPSERAFSTGGNTVTAKRCSLAPELVRDIVFLSENFREKTTHKRSKG